MAFTLHKLKIGQKFALSFSIITLGPLLTVAYLSYSNSKFQLEDKIIDSFIALNNARVANINDQIQLRLEQTRQLAGTFLTRQLSIDANNEPWLVAKMQGHVASVFDEMRLKSQGTYRYIDQPTDIESIGFVDVKGQIIVNTEQTLIGQGLARPIMERVARTGTYFAGLFENTDKKGSHLMILGEVRHWETGTFAGAILLRVNGDILNDITTNRRGLGETGETYIVRRDGLLITRSRFVKDAPFHLKINTPATRSCFEGYQGSSIYKSYRGTTVLGIQKYMPDQDWCMISEMDTAEAFASVDDLRNKMLLLIGVVVFLILIFMEIMNTIFIRPIVNLRNAAIELGQGNMQVQVKAKSQDELGELSQEFNHMVDNLREDKQMLEEQKHDLQKVNEELDRFVYTASHDLRAPLRGIASFAVFLEEEYKDKLDAQGKDYLAEINKGAVRLNNLIDDLLELSRISRIKNPYEQVDIKRTVEMVKEQLSFDIMDNNVELLIAKDLPTITCDPIKIKTLFLNLINNAIKFSSKQNKKRPRVEVGYHNEMDAHRFFVKDNGIGIPAEFHEQIFDLFRKLHPDREYEGTGAGLSIVKAIVEDHGGKIWVESTEGQGAAFYFTVPKDLSDAAISTGQVRGNI